MPISAAEVSKVAKKVFYPNAGLWFARNVSSILRDRGVELSILKGSS